MAQSGNNTDDLQKENRELPNCLHNGTLFNDKKEQRTKNTKQGWLLNANPESKDSIVCDSIYMTFWRRQNNMDGVISRTWMKQDIREMKIGVKTVTNESNCITNGWHKHIEGSGKGKKWTWVTLQNIQYFVHSVKIKTRWTVYKCYILVSNFFSYWTPVAILELLYVCRRVEQLRYLFRYTDIFIYILDKESQISYCWKKKGERLEWILLW